MSADEINEINSAFQRKIKTLDETIEFLNSQSGTDPPKGGSVAFFAATANNVKDLYEMFQATMNLMVAYRKQLDLISSRTDNLGDEVKGLKQNYDQTLGSLKNRLKKINETDEKRKQSDKDKHFYG